MNNTTDFYPAKKGSYDTLEMYEALLLSLTVNIERIKKILNNNICSVSIFFQCTEKGFLNGFSHQILFNKTGGVPQSFSEFLKTYEFVLMAEKSLVEKEIQRLKQIDVDN